MTFEEIKTELEKSPDLLKQVISSFKDSSAKVLETEGYVVRTTDDDKSYVEAQVKAVLPQKIGEEFSKAMNAIDAKVKTITGVEKNAGEKTTDYAERAIAELKSRGADPVTAQRVRQLEQQLESTKTEYEGKLTDLNKSMFNKEIDLMVSSALSSLSIAVPGHIKTEEEKQSYIGLQRKALKTMFNDTFSPRKDEAGNVIFYEGDKQMLSTKDGKPKSADELIAEKFSAYFIKAGQQGSGSGSGQNGPVGGNGGASGFRTKDDIHQHLAASGYTVGSKAYVDNFDKLAKESNVAV